MARDRFSLVIAGRYGAWAGLAVALALTVMAPAALVAQAEADDTTDLVIEAITLRYRNAAQAVQVVHPLLSGRGTVELQPGGNTLVLRDVPRAIKRIMPLLREFDQPANLVTVRVQIVAASSETGGSQVGPSLPAALISRLRDLLRYENYSLLAKTEFAVQEGLEAAYELSNEYRVDFMLGRLLEDRRISLEGFKISRRRGDGEMAPLIHTNLNLNLGRPMVLGLAESESSDRALMVVVECQQGEMLLTER
jgi:hypothetical protein